MKTILWVNISSLKEQMQNAKPDTIKNRNKEEQEEVLWVGAISEYNPIFEEIKGKTATILIDNK